MSALFETRGDYQKLLHITRNNLHRLKPNHFLISDELTKDLHGDLHPVLSLRIPPYGERSELWQTLRNYGLVGTSFHVFEHMSDARNVLGYDHEFSGQWEALE